MKIHKSHFLRYIEKKGFALISTLIVLSLLLVLSLAMLGLSSVETRSSGGNLAELEAQANARLALQLAIADLQRYAGPDQRVTARADITDKEWNAVDTKLSNPYYTLVWDVSGSEMDLEPSISRENLTTKTENHRPGMRPGHDFKKVPAVLVSGNHAFDLTNGEGAFDKTEYPSGYITPESQQSSNGESFITIVPKQKMLFSKVQKPQDIPSVRVPLVNIPGGGGMAWWVGDESIKNRMNLGNRHEPNSRAASMLAQRSPINLFKQGLDNSGDSLSDGERLLTTPTLVLAFSKSLENDWSYSPDLSSVSESLLTDVRSGGLKQDLTFALFNPESTSGMPIAFQDSQPVLDSLDNLTWGGQSGIPGNSNLGGISPHVSYLRSFAQRSQMDPTIPVNMGDDDLAPVVSQAQGGIHAAYRIVGGSKFQVYYSIFPSVTLWNPYNVPIKLNKKMEIFLERRSGTSNWWLNLFRANYSIRRQNGTIAYSNNNIFTQSQSARAGWNFKMVIEPSETVIIEPGKSMVFSPDENRIIDSPAAPNSPESSKRTTYEILVKPGWRPGKGLLFSLDGLIHDAAALDPGSQQFPQLSFGMGGTANDNVVWTARYDDGGRWKYFSYWSRLNSKLGGDSAFFDPPATSDVNQDVSGGFPALLYKYALRMGEDYLTVDSQWIHSDQKTLLFPYMANYNPRAIFHAGIGDSYTLNSRQNLSGFLSSEGTEGSPSIMGAVYDFQNARTSYTVPTTGDDEMFTFIGSGYLGPADKMVLAEASVGLPIDYPNSASGSLVSITQLNGSNIASGSRTPAGPLRYLWLATSNYPAFPFGNSVADFRLNVEHRSISKNKLVYIDSLAKSDLQNWRVQSRVFDLSYLLNDRFYDHYFFSTIPQDGSYSATDPLMNSRLIPNASFDLNNSATLKDINSARNLTLQGGFNINSTSVSAWEMLLSSSIGIERDGVNDATNRVTSYSHGTTAKGSVDIQNMTEADAASGDKHVKLSEAQVRSLAQEIVKQVKRRGPFPSLSAFVNRVNHLEDVKRNNANEYASTGYTDVRFTGAIQAALDKLKLSDNLDQLKPIPSSDYVQDDRFYPSTKSLRSSAYSHLPGTLKQSDILRQIDPVMTARGDTFVIRAIGVSKDAQGKIIATAACEAVVQRSLEYYDNSQNAATSPYSVNISGGNKREYTSALKPLNRRYGRRFQVKSFLWLPAQEVALMTTE